MSRPETTDYSLDLPDFGDLMTVEDWLAAVKQGAFIDYDGHGRAVKGDKMDGRSMFLEDSGAIIPSDGDSRIPLDATHIMWFNR